MRLLVLFSLISFYSVGQSGLKYIQNKGQWNEESDFQAKIPGGLLGLSAKGFSVLLVDQEAIEEQHMTRHQAVNEFNGQPSGKPITQHYFQINFLGSNTSSKPIAEKPWDGYYNYFIGNDSCKWASNVIAFESVLYPEIYSGIDLRVSSIGNNLKYDFIVSPGSDPSQVKIEYSGTSGIEKLNDELNIQTALGSLTELKPYSYQVNGETKQTIQSEFRLTNNTVSFSFPNGYDECQSLIIDPLLIFSTYSGSTADNWGSTATPGEHGTLYSAGVTNQFSGGFFPATVGAFQTTNHGNFDMAVIKYDSAGTKFLYATHLGGINNDTPESLVVDKATGDLIVLGLSSSPDYPTGAGSYDRTFNFGTTIFNRVFDTNDQWDIVVTRLSPDGKTLVGSTFLGGSGNDGLNLPKQSGGPLVVNYGDEMRGDVITDADGNVYISSVTSSSNFPIVNGFDDTFNGGTTDGLVVKLSPDLSSIIWSSYVGGTGFDAAYSIKFDADNNILMAGGTTSADFPVTAGSYQTAFNGIVDGWIMRIAGDGSSILNATYTGTSSFDQVYFIDLNSNGNVFCYGQTAGHMPITAGVYHNNNSGQFLQKFSPDLSTLQLSTVFGSASSTGLVIPNISPTAFLVNDCNNIYMAGWGGFVNSSISTGFWQSSTFGMPITNDAYQKTTSGSDFYFIVLNGDATQLVYSTFLGGSSSKTHVDGGTSRFDKYGIVYHAVCSGCQFGNTTGHQTSDFPTTPNAKSRFNLSSNCNNAAFKFDLSSLKALFQTNSLDLTMPGFNNVCFPDSIVFQNISTGGKIIDWDFGDGTLVTLDSSDPPNIIHQYQQAGQYNVKLTITDLSTCSQTDFTTQTINYFKDNIVIGESGIICDGTGYQLNASGGTAYNWTSNDGTFFSSEPSPLVHPSVNTAYYVKVTDANGCSKKDTVIVGVIPLVKANFQTYSPDFTKSNYNSVCFPDSIRFKNLSKYGENYSWEFGDGSLLNTTKSDTVSFIHSFKNKGTYKVKLKAYNSNTCNKVDSVFKTINYYKNEGQAGEDSEICAGTSFKLTATGGTSYAWSTPDNSFSSSEASPFVRPSKTTQYNVTIRDSHNCIKKDTLLLSVLDSVALKWQYQLEGNCTDRPTIRVTNLSPIEEEVNFTFDFGDGTDSNDVEAEHVYEKDNLYTLRFIAQRKFCAFEEAVTLPIYTIFVPNVLTPESSSGYNDSFEIGFGADKSTTNINYTLQLNVVDRWGKNVFESSDYKNDWNANGIPGGIYYLQLKVGDLTTCKTWLHIVK